MNYRHAYHAGNSADVFKHLILLSLIQKLSEKNKPFDCLDTHAGAGMYVLTGEAAQKTGEFLTGIGQIVKQTHKKLPNLVQKYLEQVYQFGYPQKYPGSPCLIRQNLSASDRLLLVEKHPDDFLLLKKVFESDRQVAVHHRDAYEALLALLPLKARRGCVLIDPPYEKEDEWAQINKILPEAVQKFSQGIFALWYPLKGGESIDAHLNRIRKKVPDSINISVFELTIYSDKVRQGLIGSGMMILNPPWQLAPEVNQWLSWLWKVLSIDGQGFYRCREI